MPARAMGHTYAPGADGAPARVVLEVWHLDTDSYSRSVDRAGMAWARTVGSRMYPGAWSLTDAAYSVREEAPGSNGRGQCVSTHVYTVRK